MTITFPRELPVGLKTAKVSFTLDVNDTVFESDIARIVNIQSHGAGTTDRFTGELSTNNLKKSDWLDLTAWINSLKGRQGTFLVNDPDREFAQTFAVNPGPTFDDTTVTFDSDLITFDAGEFPGLGAVDGAGQSGNSLNTRDWPVSSTIMKTGDMFQQQVQAHMLTEDAVTDAFGKVKLQFEPTIRTSPPDNAVIKTKKAQIIARRISSTIPFNTEEVAFLPITIGFEEVI